MDELNQQYDRITNILKSQSGVQPNVDRALAIANMFDPQGYVQAVQQEQMRPVQNQLEILKVLEAQRNSGDARAKQLEDRINLFTGGDPEGNAMILQALHDDPEEIDPSNSYQTTSKIAGIVKKSGYKSPVLELDKRKKMAEVAKLERESIGATKPLSKEGKLAADLAAGYIDQGTFDRAINPNATNPQKANEVKSSALEVLDRLLQNKSGVEANRGGVSTLFPNISDSAVNAEADLDTLASLLTTENLGLLKGVLSDTDMRVLKDIGAGGLKGSDAQVMKNLETIKQKLSSELGIQSTGREPGELVGTSGGKKVYKVTNPDGTVKYVKER